MENEKFYIKNGENVFHIFKTDEFMIKILPGGKSGSKLTIQMRRHERRPNTISLYPVPIFEISVEELLNEDKRKEISLIILNTILSHSRNVNEIILSENKEKSSDCDTTM